MLKVHARKLGTVAVLYLQGQIVTGETDTLYNAVHSLFEVSAIKLDFARVSTVDGRGLGAMLVLRQQAEARGISFELMNVPKLVGKVLELARLDSVFQITSGVNFLPAVSRSHRASVAKLASCA